MDLDGLSIGKIFGAGFVPLHGSRGTGCGFNGVVLSESPVVLYRESGDSGCDVQVLTSDGEFLRIYEFPMEEIRERAGSREPINIDERKPLYSGGDAVALVKKMSFANEIAGWHPWER
ncbi:MAG: hypothetical protein V1889_00630 [archaeon]